MVGDDYDHAPTVALGHTFEVTPKSCTSDLWVSCAAQPSR